jgi:acyl dehydratase
MSTSSLITKNMEAVIGSILEWNSVRVEPGAIEQFSAAIGDRNPIYYMRPEKVGDKLEEALIAPPTFLRSISPAILQLPDGARFSRIVDGGSRWQYFLPIRAGDRITYTVNLQSLSEKEGKTGPMLVAVYLIEYSNQNNSLVANQENTLIRFK